MRFKINEIGDGGLPVKVSVTSEWLAATCPDLDAHPGPDGLRFKGQITPTGDDYLLRGELAGDLDTPCARCLEPARVHVDAARDGHVRSGRRRGRRPEEDDEAGLHHVQGRRARSVGASCATS